MSNLAIYNEVRGVPDNAKRQIQAGRLKGKTDINPMWRIKTLTGRFGPCGIGWKYTIDRQWIEVGASGEQAAFCNISLYIKSGDAWSEAIPGTGGSSFVANEHNGAYTSDECYKMALTDAISVACKALGFGADVYWAADRTKYDALPAEEQNGQKSQSPLICEVCGKPIGDGRRPSGALFPAAEIAASTKSKLGRQMCLLCAAGKADGN